MAAEDSRLLDKKGHPSYDSTEDATLSIQVPSPFQEDNIQTTHSTNFPVSSSNKNLFKIFNKRAGSYDEDRQALVDESTGIRVWSESYSSIDWIHDSIKDGIRKRKLQSIPGWRGDLLRASDASQAWILVILIGAVVAAIAWLIDVVQEWMTDLKQGYCTTDWKLNSKFCCWEKETCDAWRTWPQVFGVEDSENAYYSALIMYMIFGLVFSGIAALLVKLTAEKVTIRKPAKPMVFSKSPSMASIYSTAMEHEDLKRVDTNQYKIKTAYYSAGSGIPEVKVILGGFVIKGFLGIKTLIVKSIGMIFSTSAGLTLGKEGPFVHLACSAGNIACRLFPKFNKNENRKREILSAAAAAGIAVAFGAPIGGVLFSLEEVSYYFPTKTLIRSYCAAMVAAVVLKITDPFGTGKIVLYQVEYDKDYHIFEMVPLLICGALSGFFGAFVTYTNIKYQYMRKSTIIGKYPVIEVLVIMIITVILNFWNPFSRIGLSEFALQLFSECSPENDNAGLCARTVAEIPQLLYLLFATLIIKLFLTTITFGCAVPGGIFLPSLIIGAVTGRMIGLVMQFMTLTYPNAWPFTVCAHDLATRGECVIPGVYALVGAASALAGLTRTTISLVVIMFELTYSLSYALPIMMSVMVSKWVADAMYKEGVYDLLIEMKGYPFLESKKDYVHTMTIDQLTESLSTIDIDEPITVDQLRYKLSIVSDLGYGEDGGFPILRDGRILEGYIATSELQHGLEQLERSLESSLSDADIGTVLCYFKKSETAYGITSYSLDSTLDDTIRNLLIQNTSKQNLEGSIETRLLLNEFIQYVDHAPLTINQNASVTLLMEMFIKLGAGYVCVTRSDGRYNGIIHKRRLLSYLKELEEEK